MNKKQVSLNKNMGSIGLAFSGGLDTSFCVVYLQEQGYEVITLTVDTGGFDKSELKNIAGKSKLLGAEQHYFVDGKQQLYDQFISYIIKGNILRGGIYPLCAGTERLIIVQKLIEIAQKKETGYVAHGSTGAGNDQVRFDVALQILAPKLKVLSPIRELGVTREVELGVLKKHQIPISFEKSAYSINQSILGITVGGKETKNSWEAPSEKVFPGINPLDETPNQPTEIILSFKKGLPVAINGKKMDGITILQTLNKVGGQHGIGKNIHLGNTIIGIKGRVAFAAPAMTIVIKAHQELEKLVQTKWQSFWKGTLSDFYGQLLHEALYFDPVMRDMEAMIDSSQQKVTGDVKVKLFKGNILINGSRSPYSLMDSEIATYGEKNMMWDSRDVVGFSKIYAIPSMLATVINKRKKI